MASSSFSDAPDPDTLETDSKSVTIVINDNGEINYDEKTLQSIIGKICFDILHNIHGVLYRKLLEKWGMLSKIVLTFRKPAGNLILQPETHFWNLIFFRLNLLLFKSIFLTVMNNELIIVISSSIEYMI